MGLAASQARLLTITARKSDCEYQSMRYSHEKIALSRSMTDLSTEYQNSLNQTKLVYDFYGTGDETTPLSYGLMMTPSQMNGYLPILATDTSGKAVLSSQYAAAARAAGIPQEGLGCLPSSDVRNKFIQGLADSGLITSEAANVYMGIQYSQSIGMGATDLATTQVTEMTLSELIEYYETGQFDQIPYSYSNATMLETLQANNSKVHDFEIRSGSGVEDSNQVTDGTDITLGEILDGDYQILCRVNINAGGKNTQDLSVAANNIASLDIWEWMFGEFEALLNVTNDPNVSSALKYARSKVENLLNGDNLGFKYSQYKTKEDNQNGFNGVIDCMNGVPRRYSGNWFQAGNGMHEAEGSYNTADYIGLTVYDNPKGDKSHHFADGASISVTNIALAYLTYFAQAMEGLATSRYTVDDDAESSKEVANSHLIDDQFTFSVVTGTGINSDQALISGFYDAIFNQICSRGWVENNRVTENDYLHEMMKTGKFFLTTCGDDGFYAQGNYSTNNFVREVTDEEAVAQAEAKYNTEKQKLNQKEEVLDLKMKNLDTEISSLTTEYDTVKSVISKNIEKSFKRYDA